MVRRTVIEDYPHQLGGHCGSSSFRDLLEIQRGGRRLSRFALNVQPI